MRISFFTVLSALIFASPLAHGRVFNPKESTFAAYIRGTGGLSGLDQTPFADSSGASTTFSSKDEAAYHYSGEAGVMFMISDQSRFRIGIEAVQARDVDAVGKVGGAKAMDVTSQVIAIMPVANLELDLSSGEGSKYFMFVGAGYAKIRSSNQYDLNALGAATYGGISDYKETVTGNCIAGQIGAGAEWHAVDNVTFVLEAGYRYLIADKLSYENSQNTAEGTTVEGGDAKINNGTEARELDMSGLFVGFSFRFFIPPLN